MISFENTQVAFESKSDADLRRAYQLFKLIGNRNMVKIGKPLTNFALTVGLPIKGLIKKTIFAQFCGGETIDGCDEKIQTLGKYGIGTILDYSEEKKTSDEDFEHTTNEIIATILKGKNNASIPFAVFKVTGIARFDLLLKVSANEELTKEETQEYERVYKRVESIVKKGYELGVPVLVDAEETWIQPVLDTLFLEFMQKYNKEKAIVQNTYQMYCHKSINSLKAHHQIALENGVKFGLKIVRGAYMEKERLRAKEMGYPSSIQPDKASTDKDFNAIIHYLVNNVDTIDFMVATHNEESTDLLARLIKEKNLPLNHPSIYFAQLYGMSDHITFNLADKGYNVAKYVPYGAVKTMMPYLFRRAEENSSVKGQTSRELRLIEQEIKRRKGK